jgi:hypothetical protein
MKNKIIGILYVLISQLAFAQSLTVLPSGFTPGQSGSYPRLTNAAILALPSPQLEDIAYDLTYNCVRVYNGSKWVSIMQNNSGPSASASTSGGTSFDEAYSVDKDPIGNLYVTGYYKGTATFGSFSKTSEGQNDIFVAKYNPSGTCLWVVSEGSYDIDIGQDIRVDFQGNVYITGNIGISIFTAKYSTNGIQLWTRSEAGNSINGASGMALDIDGNNNVYVVGYFDFDFQLSGINLTSFGAGISDIIIIKYNTLGVPQWAKTAGGPGPDVATDVNVYNYFGGSAIKVTGYIAAPGARFNNNVANVVNCVGGDDIFVCEYNVNGTFSSAFGIGTIYNDRAWGIVSAIAGTETYIVGEQNSKFFLTKLNSSNTEVWTQTSTGIGTCKGLDIKRSLFDIIVTGYFESGTYINGNFQYNNGGSDIFLARYNTFGSLVDIQTYGSSGNDLAQGIVETNANSSTIAGSFSNTITIGNSIKTTLGGKDILIANIEN